jgi:GT2 family glycosyltransferase
VHVVVVSCNSASHLEACLAAIDSAWAELSITVFDNASSDSSAAVAARHDAVEVIQSPENLGFAAGVNRAVASSRRPSDWILLVNPDAVLDPGAIDTLLAAALRYPGAGAFGGRGRAPGGRPLPASCLAAPSLFRALRYATGSASGLNMPRRLYAPERQLFPVPAISGACLLVDAKAFHQVGGFDERFFLYGEDVDFSMRLKRLGYPAIYVAPAGYTHVGSASSTSRAAKRIRMLAGTIALYGLHGGRLGGVSQWLVRFGALARLAVKAPWDAHAGAVWRRRRAWWGGYASSETTAHAARDPAGE